MNLITLQEKEVQFILFDNVSRNVKIHLHLKQSLIPIGSIRFYFTFTVGYLIN